MVIYVWATFAMIEMRLNVMMENIRLNKKKLPSFHLVTKMTFNLSA